MNRLSQSLRDADRISRELMKWVWASIGAVMILVVIFFAAASLAGCGGGDMSAADIAQHDADMQALVAMKTSQPVNCAPTSGVTPCL